MVTFFQGLFQNRIFLASGIGWLSAQIIKTLIHLLVSKEFRPERLVGAGGMPSSHAATVCACVITTYAEFGSASFQFAIAMLLAIIVIYDARGVRYETGKQAVVINKLMDDLEDIFNEKDPDIVLPKLKELVGHTPLQVIVGGILGTLVGVIFVIFFY